MDNSVFSADILAAVEVMKNGGVILYPTDTIWGLGCDPFNENAVSSVFKLKSRSVNKSLILLTDNLSLIAENISPVSQKVKEMAEHSDRPLTIVYPGAHGFAHGVAAGDGTVAVRCTKDPFCVALIRAFGAPVVSTSANISDQPFNGSFSDISHEIIDNVDFVVNWRKEEKINAKPSGIIRIERSGEITIIRP